MFSLQLHGYSSTAEVLILVKLIAVAVALSSLKGDTLEIKGGFR